MDGHGKNRNWTSSSVRPKYTTGGNAFQTPKLRKKKAGKKLPMMIMVTMKVETLHVLIIKVGQLLVLKNLMHTLMQ